MHNFEDFLLSIIENDQNDINQIEQKFLDFLNINYSNLKFCIQKKADKKALDNIKLDSQNGHQYLVIEGNINDYNSKEKKIVSIVKILKILLQSTLFEKEVQKIKKILKKSEKDLKESEEKNRRVIEAVTDYIYTVKIKDGKPIETIHGSACIIVTGYTAAEFKENPYLWIEMVYKDDFDIVKNHAELALSGKYSNSIEHRIIRKDGKIRWVRNTTVLHYDNNDNFIAYDGIVQDITERKLAELALLDSEERLRQIIKQMPYPIEVFDIDGMTVLVNKAFIELFGIPNENIVINKYNVFKGPDILELFNLSEVIKKAFKGDTVNIPELIIDFDKISYKNKFKKKGFLYIEITMFPVFRKSGEIWRVVVIMKDITLRKVIENEKEQLLRELASKNEELESVVYVSSHDLRSPLVNIQGFSNEVSLGFKEIKKIMQNSNIDEESKLKIDEIFNKDINESLNFIIKSVDKMDGLLKGLLRLSRLGREALDKKIINMNTLIKDIVKELQFQIQSNNVELIIDNLPECFGDYVQINQVFTNLIDNSIKYLDANKKGKIRITGNRQNNESLYNIIDNGVGIDLKYQKKVFEIFHRVNPNGNVKGEGLGLSIVKRIIDRHNGKIWLESKPGEGSTFFVLLPCKINIK